MNLAIDCDGVLVDYNAGYIRTWESHFGFTPILTNPAGLTIMDRYHIPVLNGDELASFKESFNDDFFSNLTPLPGAVEACQMLRYVGFTLYCVTAIDYCFVPARKLNLSKHDFGFTDVIATPPPEGYDRQNDASPKAKACASIDAVALIDDHLPFLRGLPSGVRSILLTQTVPSLTRHVDESYKDLLTAVKTSKILQKM